MVHSFLQFIEAKSLLEGTAPTLVAVSGGVDSVVLCHLFSQARLPFGIAHCNFQLRGLESDLDETFVSQLAKNLEVPFWSTRFDTRQFARNRKVSVQMAGRQLRYDWLEQIRRTQAFSSIATAHHLDDSIETALYNFSKGCGLRGLHGILPKQENLIRPLLFASKKEILAFAKEFELEYRTDATNLEDKYARNYIRLHVIPALCKINPSFEKSAAETIERLKEAEIIFQHAIEVFRGELLQLQGSEWRIDKKKLLSYPAPATVLYELLRPFGFNNHQTGQIYDSLTNQPGGLFLSPPYRLLHDRHFLIITRVENAEGGNQHYIISLGLSHLDGGSLTAVETDGSPLAFSADANRAWLDMDKLKLPLVMRRWQPGDYFFPLGMKGKRQKLQDFFTNRKLSRFEKEKVWILESEGAICWIVGQAIDDRFKITGNTRRCLALVWEPEATPVSKVVG